MLRAASVSSMRNTNVPPWWRANAQLNSAVRARPTCGLAGRRRAEPDADVLGRQVAEDVVSHRVTTLFVRVPMPAIETSTSSPTLHGTDALGGAGEDHVAGQQRHHAGDVGDQGRDVEDQVLGASRPAEVAVEVGLDARRRRRSLRVEVGLDPRPERAERVEALGPGELPVASSAGRGRSRRWRSCSRGSRRSPAPAGTSRQIRPITTASSPS